MTRIKHGNGDLPDRKVATKQREPRDEGRRPVRWGGIEGFTELAGVCLVVFVRIPGCV
jgi:hypothetical protein